jgi:uncharacterized lipoprotein YddW (UPF0748 family)
VPRSSRRFTPVRLINLLLLSPSLLVTCASGHEAAAEVRGTWLTTTANSAIAGPAESEATMAALREIGLNTVYVETWKNGYTQFPSATLARTIGPDRTPSLGQRDLLEETLIQAHRHGLLYIAWFEYGFMAAHQGNENHLLREKRAWLSEDIEGQIVAPNGFIWMNPLHPEVREFLVNLVLDAVDRYDLDGVQLDDRLAWPHYTMGYDSYTRSVYAKEHDGKEPPADPRNPEWLRWRAEKITEFAREFHLRLRAARPELILSVSPGPYPWSYDNYACDWPSWAKEGLFDEYVPQVYRTSLAAFQPEWERQMGVIAGRERDLLAGIRIVGSGPDTSWEDLRGKIETSRSPASGGHVHWFSRGVLDLYRQELTTLYEAPVPHPRRPADWRPPPLAADAGPDDSGFWKIAVPYAGTYRIVARRGERWTEESAQSFEKGEVKVQVHGADAVELLLDRRKSTPDR